MLFTKSLEVTKLHCVTHRQVDFCVVNYEYFDNHLEFLKKICHTLGSPEVMECQKISSCGYAQVKKANVKNWKLKPAIFHCVKGHFLGKLKTLKNSCFKSCK